MGVSQRAHYCQSASFRAPEDWAQCRRWFWAVAVLAVCTASGHLLTAQPVEVPVVNAKLGPCSADFTVTDSSSKPIYDAKISATILYGFMNKRRSDLEIGTNSDGKARFEGLPAKLKKPPLEFRVRSGDASKSVMHDPAVDCRASISVALGKP